MGKRTQVIYYNVKDGSLLDSGGDEIRSMVYPYINYKERIIIQLHLVTDELLTAYTGLGDSSDIYSVAVDNDFDHDTTVMCKTLDADINVAGDWAQADAAQGKFSIRLNADTASYASKTGVLSEKKNTMLELLAYDGSVSGDLIFAIQIPFRCFNTIDDDGAVPV